MLPLGKIVVTNIYCVVRSKIFSCITKLIMLLNSRPLDKIRICTRILGQDSPLKILAEHVESKEKYLKKEKVFF